MKLGSCRLNKSGIYFNEYGTTRLVNNFCYSIDAWGDKTCMSARNNTEKEESAIAKRVKNSFNTDRPVNSAVDN